MKKVVCLILLTVSLVYAQTDVGDPKKAIERLYEPAMEVVEDICTYSINHWEEGWSDEFLRKCIVIVDLRMKGII